MDTIFMKSESSQTSNSHVLINKLTDQTDLTIGEKSVALSNLSIYYKCRNVKNSCNNN